MTDRLAASARARSTAAAIRFSDDVRMKSSADRRQEREQNLEYVVHVAAIFSDRPDRLNRGRRQRQRPQQQLAGGWARDSRRRCSSPAASPSGSRMRSIASFIRPSATSSSASGARAPRGRARSRQRRRDQRPAAEIPCAARTARPCRCTVRTGRTCTHGGGDETGERRAPHRVEHGVAAAAAGRPERFVGEVDAGGTRRRRSRRTVIVAFSSGPAAGAEDRGTGLLSRAGPRRAAHVAAGGGAARRTAVAVAAIVRTR